MGKRKSRRRRQPRAEPKDRLTACGSLGLWEAAGSPQIISSSNGGGKCCSWSDLPGDLLMSILLMLNPVDYSSFRGVCRGWRSAAKDGDRVYMSSLPPLLLQRRTCALYSFKDDKFLYVKANNMTEQSSDHGEVTGSQGNRPVTSRRRLDRDNRILSFSHGYLIALDKNDRTRLILADALTWTIEDGIRFPTLEDEPVHLPPPYHFLMTSPPTSPDCLLVGMSIGTVHYCRPGDTRWKLHQLQRQADGRLPMISVDCAAAIGQKLYILTQSRYELLELELLPTCPRVTKVEAEWLPPLIPRLFQPALVECGGELLVVNSQFRRWAAYRLDRPARRWVQVHDLGGRAIALGIYSAGVSWQPTGNAWDERGRDCIYYVYGVPSLASVIRLTDGRHEEARKKIPIEGDCAGFQLIVPGLCASPTAS